jgi:hypothetical protein
MRPDTPRNAAQTKKFIDSATTNPWKETDFKSNGKLTRLAGDQMGDYSFR